MQLYLIIWAVWALGWLLEIIEEMLWQPLARKLLSLSQLHWQKLGQPIEQSLLLRKYLFFVFRQKGIVWGLSVLCNPRDSAKPCMDTWLMILGDQAILYILVSFFMFIGKEISQLMNQLEEQFYLQILMYRQKIYLMIWTLYSELIFINKIY